MSKVYIYRKKDDTVTIYYSKEFVEERDLPVFEYDADDIPEGPGVLKTDGKTLYLEVIEPKPEVEVEETATADDILNALLGVTDNE